jgi:arylsulfatase A-like enzyme
MPCRSPGPAWRAIALTLVLAATSHPATGSAGGRAGAAERGPDADRDLARVVHGDMLLPEPRPEGFHDDPGRPVVIEPPGRPQLATTTRPNIVVFMVDDLPPLDGRLWSRLRNIRSMFFDHGTRFPQAFGDTPLCCPGRVNFLTGLWTVHHGVTINDARQFRPRMSIATQLKGAGYFTIASGKYLNGTFLLKKTQPRGWDRASINGGLYYNYTLFRNGVAEYHDDDPNDYSTDVFANEAIASLRMAPPEKPVFAFLAPYAAHSLERGRVPLAAPRHIGDPRCATMPPWHPEAYDELDVSDKPGYVRRQPRVNWPEGFPMVPVCESMLSVDQLVGRVRAELKAQGRLDNTLFVLTADNGMNYGVHRLYSKNTPYATPVPMFMHWRAQLGMAPLVIRETVQTIDLAPTFCEIGGCRLGPYPTGQAGPDGVSLMPLVRARGGSLGRDVILHSHLLPYQPTRMPAWYALRTTPGNPLGRWLYVEYASGERELYDLRADRSMLLSLHADPATEAVRAALHVRLLELLPP